MLGNEKWSPYGAPWLQPVAISGKSSGRKNRRNKPEPLPWDGKEGVDGSSPSEGFAEMKSPQIGDFCCLPQHHGTPPPYRRDHSRARCDIPKCAQIGRFPGTTEYLRETEGLDEVAASGRIEIRWKEDEKGMCSVPVSP